MYFPPVARAGVLRHLHLGDALARPTRAIAMQNQLRRLSLVAKPPLTAPLARNLAPIVAQQSQHFATQAGADSTKTRSTEAGRGEGKKSTATKSKKKKPKRFMTDLEKEQAKKRKEREHIKQLKATALQPPKPLPQVWHLLAFQSKVPEIKSQHAKFLDAFKATADAIQKLSPDEVERFKTQAEENRTANEASYRTWVQSHTPLQIRNANAARRSLGRITSKRITLIKDERQVKSPSTAYMWFIKERMESGDFKHMTIAESGRKFADEWRGLTEAEKEPYNKLQREDIQRYQSQHLEVYGELSRKEREQKASDSTNPE